MIKQRAARLREAGDAALRRHLDAWVGREANALVERDGFARLFDFTQVRIPFSLAEKVASEREPDEGRSAAQAPDQLNARHPLPALRNGEGKAHVRLRFTHHDGAHLHGVAA
jgi:threonylcarbamoyladenosine tRNA methylthiotransferase MtaB